MRVVISIPDNEWPEVCKSYADAFHYEDTLAIEGRSVPNPETVEQHCTRQIGEQVLLVHERMQVRAAVGEAEQATRARVRATFREQGER